MKQRKFLNMYLTTTISVALVLFLIGIECVVLLSAHHLVRRVKENFALTIVLTQDADSAAFSRIENLFQALPYTGTYRFISKEEALAEHIQHLGEDPTKFLGFNPLYNSYEYHLKPEYACQDSIACISQSFDSLPYVSRVIYPQDLVKVMDTNISEFSILLLIMAGLLLVIAWILIVNTIRLHIYSKRFLINTMRLVGATAWVIRSPFIRRSVRMGLEAGVITIVVLLAALYYIRMRLGIWFFDFTWLNLSILSVSILASGIIITFLAAVVATGKYVRMKIDRMYEI